MIEKRCKVAYNASMSQRASRKRKTYAPNPPVLGSLALAAVATGAYAIARPLTRWGSADVSGVGCRSSFQLSGWPAFREVFSWMWYGSSPWSHHFQGLTHDESNWYFSTTERVFKVPLESKTPTVVSPSVDQTSQIQGKDHFGDIDYYNGSVYVPVEPAPVKILQLDAATLKPIRSIDFLTAQSQMPWVAIRPSDGMAFSSEFLAQCIYMHNLKDGSSTRIPLSCNGAPFMIERVQGGVFDPSGKLYLSSDGEPGGIYGVDASTGVVSSRFDIPRRTKIFSFRADEVEGLTYWDLGERGQLHASVLHSFHLPGFDDRLSIRGLSKVQG